jgi:hypothetical protein
MALTLLVEDLQDGTAVLTVAGAAGAGVVRAARFTGRTEPLAWADVWNFAADGVSPPQTVTPAHYVWAAFVGSAVSPAVYQPVMDPGPALATLCRQAVIARARLLALPLIGDRVYEKAEFRNTNTSYPCVFAFPPPEGETAGQDQGTNVRSDWGHPTRLIAAHRQNPMAAPEVLPQYDKWRQMLFRGFDREALPGVPIVMQTLVTPGPVLAIYDQEFNVMGTELTVRAVARQPRGFGT